MTDATAELDKDKKAQQPAQPGLTGPFKRPENVGLTGIDDDSLQEFDVPLYKGIEGRVDRIGIIEPAYMPFARVHFGGKEVGYFICQSTFKLAGKTEVITKLAPCCERFDLPSKRVAAMVVHYATDSKGTPTKPLSFELKVWRFSEKKYFDLKKLHVDFSLATHDVKISTEDDNYQRMTITPCAESILMNEAFQRQYGAMVAEWVAATKPKIDKLLGKTLTQTQLLEKLGGAAAMGFVPAEAAVQDIATLLDE